MAKMLGLTCCYDHYCYRCRGINLKAKTRRAARQKEHRAWTRDQEA